MTKPTWNANKGVPTRDGSEAFEDAFLIVWQVVEVPAVPVNSRKNNGFSVLASSKVNVCFVVCILIDSHTDDRPLRSQCTGHLHHINKECNGYFHLR